MTNAATSLLRQRMIEDMTVRGFAPVTQRGYIAAIKDFTDFLGRRPDQAGGDDDPPRSHQAADRAQSARG